VAQKKNQNTNYGAAPIGQKTSTYTPEYGFIKPPSTYTPGGGYVGPPTPKGGGGVGSIGGPSTIPGLGSSNTGGGYGVGAQKKGGGGGQDNTSLIDPNMPMYWGPKGEQNANDNPAAYIHYILLKSGVLKSGITAYDDWANEQIEKNLLDDYLKTQGTGQGTGVVDWMRGLTGAGLTGTDAVYGGKHDTKLKTPGSYGYDLGDFSKFQDALSFATFQSEHDPAGYVNSLMGGGAGGDAEFQDWFNRTYVGQLQGELAAARRETNNPDLTLADFLKGRDVAGEANAAFSDYLSTKYPEDTIRGLASGGDMSDPDYASFFNNVLMPGIIAGFQAARRGNPKLSLNAYIAQNPGLVSGGMAQFADYKSNLHPEDYILGSAINKGAIMQAGGNMDFQNWLKSQYLPTQLGVLAGQRQTGSPTQSVKSFVDPLDLITNPQIQYAYRPTSLRQPTLVNQAGRYSWWG